MKPLCLCKTDEGLHRHMTMVPLVERKIYHYGLKLKIETTKMQMLYMDAKIFLEVFKNSFLDKFLRKTRKAKFVHKMWAYFSWN